MVGGAELGIHEIYQRVGRSHEVRIIAPPPPDASTGHVVADHRSNNYDVHRLIPEAGRLPGTLAARVVRRTPLAYGAEVIRQVRTWKPDIVNPQFVQRQGLVVAWAARSQGVPTVLSLVGRSDVLADASALGARYRKSVANQSSFVLSNSEYYLNGWQPRSPTRVIPYGVDLVQFDPSQRSEELRARWNVKAQDPVFITLGRLASVKRVDLTIRAFAAAHRVNPRIRLVIVGRGPEEEALHALARELEVAECVIFAGYVEESELPRFLASADAFVFHSMAETFGVVFAQAMAAGLPIIAASTSCVPMVVGDKSGTLFPPGDIEAFRDGMLAVVEDPARFRALGLRNRQRAEAEFDWDRIAAEYVDTFRSVLR